MQTDKAKHSFSTQKIVHDYGDRDKEKLRRKRQQT